MDPLGKKEIKEMLVLTTKKLEICLKINKHQEKIDRLLKVYLILYRLINEDHENIFLTHSMKPATDSWYFNILSNAHI